MKNKLSLFNLIRLSIYVFFAGFLVYVFWKNWRDEVNLTCDYQHSSQKTDDTGENSGIYLNHKIEAAAGNEIICSVHQDVGRLENSEGLILSQPTLPLALSVKNKFEKFTLTINYEASNIEPGSKAYLLENNFYNKKNFNLINATDLESQDISTEDKNLEIKEIFPLEFGQNSIKKELEISQKNPINNIGLYIKIPSEEETKVSIKSIEIKLKKMPKTFSGNLLKERLGNLLRIYY